MEIPKTYNPSLTESKWYSHWLEQGFFRSVPDDRTPYTIVIPPPNVTGVLHMGHMLNNTIQDVLIRRARMMGYNACWVPGTDHASIATEAKVVALLREKGIKKTDLTREQFLEHAWEWKTKYGGIILEQLKKLGASCDWERTRFTMEENLSEAVLDVFIDLYQKGFIYRGVRMVNWDPQGLTAVSDEEVIHKEVNSKLYYVRYLLMDADEKINLQDMQAVRKKMEEGRCITIATVRPETILGDTAVCVHPDDERYKNLKGKVAVIPFVNRKVPIIYDDYILMEFGTGALKVTPAHDINDYNLGVKHQLEIIDTIAPDGKMNKAAGRYEGVDRFAVRKQIVKDLEEAGHLVKTVDYKNKVGYSERTDAVIEPKLSLQWFLKMDTLSKPALEHVMNDDIRLIPEKFKNTYRHWMENVHDWCISRQLWWGQRIPAWHDEKGNFVVCKTREEAEKLYTKKFPGAAPGTLRQDEDVLDTWFSSWLWPISVFDGFKDPGNKDISYYYPTNDLITAPEILFFWVARMIIAGYEYRKEKPFSHVYLTGIVRDKQGRKMSKSLGNSPDPLDLISRYGADGVRVGMLLASPAGNDLLFDEGLCEQGRNFTNKVWNAFRLVKGWEVSAASPGEPEKVAIRWFKEQLNAETAVINEHYSRYRISDALMATYKLVWDDFCSWYLELVKPEYGKPIDETTYTATISFFEQLLVLLHPFTPFITEEIWHLVRERKEKDCIMVAPWLTALPADGLLLEAFGHFAEAVGAIRNLRNEKGISPKEALPLYIRGKGPIAGGHFDDLLKKMANLSELVYVQDKKENAVSFLVRSDEFYIPLSGKINVAAELEKLHKDLAYQQGFLKSVRGKLGNERFMANAKPELLTIEKQKEADALSKIRALEEQLAILKNEVTGQN